jgi:hypothetical protein
VTTEDHPPTEHRLRTYRPSDKIFSPFTILQKPNSLFDSREGIVRFLFHTGSRPTYAEAKYTLRVTSTPLIRHGGSALRSRTNSMQQILPEKLTVTHLDKKFPIFYESQSLTTPTKLQPGESSPHRITSFLPRPTPLKYRLGVSASGLPTTILNARIIFHTACCRSRPSQPPQFNQTPSSSLETVEGSWRLFMVLKSQSIEHSGSQQRD